MITQQIECPSSYAPNQVNLSIALTDLGTRLKLEGQVAESIALYERALAYNPKYTDALYNLGVAYSEAGQVLHTQSFICVSSRASPRL